MRCDCSNYNGCSTGKSSDFVEHRNRQPGEERHLVASVAPEGAVVSGLERGREGNWRERVNMADEDNLYLENLDEFVNDEDKIVC